MILYTIYCEKSLISSKKKLQETGVVGFLKKKYISKRNKYKKQYYK